MNYKLIKYILLFFIITTPILHQKIYKGHHKEHILRDKTPSYHRHQGIV